MPSIHLTRGEAGCTLANRCGAIVIMVDALRASTTLAALFDHGAARVLVVAELDTSCAIGAAQSDIIMVGERECVAPVGFHLGNSPRDVLAAPRMDGRAVVFTSSNGAQRLTACGQAGHILVGSPANASAVARRARALAEAEDRDIIFVSAGKFPDEEYVAPEDDAGCVEIASRIGLPIAPASQELYDYWQREIAARGLPAIFHASPHASFLVQNRLTADIDFCAQVDTLHSVPEVVGPAQFEGTEVGVEVRLRG